MRKLPLALTLLFSVFCLKGMADTITLKDGTVIEGTISHQDDKQVVVNVKVSDTISDEKIIKRDDIDKIEKTSDDNIAFEDIKNLKTDQWAMLTPEAYQAGITQLKAFLDKYPESAHKAEVQAILDTFQDEQGRQQAGDVKLYGNWIPKSAVPGRQKQIEAQTLYLKMQASAAQGSLIDALNDFDQLEKSYPGSRAYLSAIERAKNFVSGLQGEVNTAIANLQVTDAQWQQGVVITPEPQKSEMVAAHQADLAKYDAIMSAAQKTVKWPPYIPQSDKSLDALSKLAASENTRLAALPVEKMNASIAQSDQAAELVASKKFAAADSILNNAVTLWAANDDAIYLQNVVAGLTATPVHSGTAAPAAAHTPKPKPSASASASASPSPKPSFTPVGAAPASAAPAASDTGAKQGLIDFLFSIPGAVTVVVCAIGLFALTAYLQKSKRDKMDEEEESE